MVKFDVSEEKISDLMPVLVKYVHPNSFLIREGELFFECVGDKVYVNVG